MDMNDAKRLDAEKEWTKVLQAALAAAMERATMLGQIAEQAEFSLRLQQRAEDAALHELLDMHQAPTTAGDGETLSLAARVRWLGRQWDEAKNTLHEVNHALTGITVNGRPVFTLKQLDTGRFEARLGSGNSYVADSPVVARMYCLATAYRSELAARMASDTKAREVDELRAKVAVLEADVAHQRFLFEQAAAARDARPTIDEVSHAMFNHPHAETTATEDEAMREAVLAELRQLCAQRTKPKLPPERDEQRRE